MGAISQGHPAKCTHITALVLGVKASNIDSGVIFPLSLSTSAKTGFAPTLITQEAEAIKKQTEFDVARFDQQFEQLVGQTKVAVAKSGVERSGSALNISRYNAEQAEIQKDVMDYNSQVAQSQKMEQANFARMQGVIARREGEIAKLGYYAKAGESLLRIGTAG